MERPAPSGQPPVSGLLASLPSALKSKMDTLATSIAGVVHKAKITLSDTIDAHVVHANKHPQPPTETDKQASGEAITKQASTSSIVRATRELPSRPTIFSKIMKGRQQKFGFDVGAKFNNIEHRAMQANDSSELDKLWDECSNLSKTHAEYLKSGIDDASRIIGKAQAGALQAMSRRRDELRVRDNFLDIEQRAGETNDSSELDKLLEEYDKLSNTNKKYLEPGKDVSNAQGRALEAIARHVRDKFLNVEQQAGEATNRSGLDSLLEECNNLSKTHEKYLKSGTYVSDAQGRALKAIADRRTKLTE